MAELLVTDIDFQPPVPGYQGTGSQPASLSVVGWTVVNTATSGTASKPYQGPKPLPTGPSDRLEFTGKDLAYDGFDKARGTIETVTFKLYGSVGYLEQFKIKGLTASYQELVDNNLDIMPVLLKGNDRVSGNKHDNVLYGFDGNDIVNGAAGSDELNGGKGNDNLVGGAGADRLDGGSGTDTASYQLYGAHGIELTSSKGVVASLYTGKGTGGDAKGDTYVSVENLSGTKFKDTLTGNNGANILTGLAGDDWLNGGKGNDQLGGGSGDDTLRGGNGNDHVFADDGNDSIWLGQGKDVFHFASNDGVDTVFDFDVKHDKLDLTEVFRFDINADNFATFLKDTDDGAAVSFSNGDQVVLVGVEVADLSAGNFLF